jgi:hypothetical protein
MSLPSLKRLTTDFLKLILNTFNLVNKKTVTVKIL